MYHAIAKTTENVSFIYIEGPYAAALLFNAWWKHDEESYDMEEARRLGELESNDLEVHKIRATSVDDDHFEDSHQSILYSLA
jgi:hypothetical protein